MTNEERIEELEKQVLECNRTILTLIKYVNELSKAVESNAKSISNICEAFKD